MASEKPVILRRPRSGRLEGRKALIQPLLLVLVLLCQACKPLPTGLANQPGFEKRPPPPGQPGWFETIKFVNDGVQYLQPWGSFVVSPLGDLCFRGALEVTIRRLANYRNYWCMPPRAVAAVEALDDDVTHIPMVRLWCRHDAPYCAFRVNGFPWYGSYPLADTITVQMVPYRREKAAVEHLVYMMGGQPAPSVGSGLDSGRLFSSVPGPTGKWEEPR